MRLSSYFLRCLKTNRKVFTVQQKWPSVFVWLILLHYATSKCITKRKKGNRKKTVSKQPSARDAAPRPRRAFRPAGEKTGVRRAHLSHGRALDTPNCQHYKKNLTRQARITWVQGTSCDKLSCQQKIPLHSGFKWQEHARNIIFKKI